MLLRFLPKVLCLLLMAGWGTVSSLIKVAEGFTAPESVGDLPEEELESRLRELGVALEDTDSLDAKNRCLSVLLSDDFWREHYQMHASCKRVKNWMWVHGKYREYLKDLLAVARDAEAAEDSRYLAAVKKLGKRFHKLNHKIIDHSQFEDQQLFKYFMDKSEDAACKNSIANLMKENEERAQVEAVEEVLTGGMGRREDLVRVVKEYIDGMMLHMEHAERVLLCPWLSLSPSQYRDYRSYLSWKYSVMY